MLQTEGRLDELRPHLIKGDDVSWTQSTLVTVCPRRAHTPDPECLNPPQQGTIPLLIIVKNNARLLLSRARYFGRYSASRAEADANHLMPALPNKPKRCQPRVLPPSNTHPISFLPEPSPGMIGSCTPLHSDCGSQSSCSLLHLASSPVHLHLLRTSSFTTTQPSGKQVLARLSSRNAGERRGGTEKKKDGVLGSRRRGCVTRILHCTASENHLLEAV